MLVKTLKGLMNKAGARAKAQPRIGNRVLGVHYHVRAFDPEGNLKWEDEFDNLVVDEGLNHSLEQHLKGIAYTADWYVGLADGTPTFAAGDDMAAHAGWVEIVAYDELVRQDLTLGAVAAKSVDNVGNEATFTISANNTTIGGAFIVDDDTKGGGNGGVILYGGGAFTAGDKVLDDDDTLEVTVTLTAAAA